jgi:hypothetical protein
MDGGESAARRYREITGGMSEAVARMRRDDADRANQLSHELVGLHERMSRANDRAALSALVVALQWQSALDELATEQWMALRPMPKPDPDAQPHELDYLDAVVAQRFEALREAVRKRGLIGRR